MPYPFYQKLAKIINSQQSRSVILYGNVYDLFQYENQYMPLIDFLTAKAAHPQIMQVVYELNGSMQIENEEMLKQAWVAWKTGKDFNDLVIARSIKKRHSDTQLDDLSKEFSRLVRESQGNATLALQFLRQLTMCSKARLRDRDGRKINLLVIIEGADLLLPAGKDVASLGDTDRRRIAIMQDWFSDPAFCAGGDSVCLIAESRSQVHPRISQLPQVLGVEVPSPDTEGRLKYIEWFCETQEYDLHWEPGRFALDECETRTELARLTACLSIHALRQLLSGAKYAGEAITPDSLVAKVEEFIKAQVGDDVVEFKKPSHSLKDVVGFTKLKSFIEEELIPRFRAYGEKALPGAAVAGPIGGGKTFIFEAVAAELGVPVLVLKNIRSQWFGQTDVIFERLRRVLEALEKVIIFVDEADTQFGGVGAETHSTERRLTGKIQAMMSDPKLRGKVTWLLMTARINLLSPDIRRPGRVGDLIIPVLDPEGEDHKEFVDWLLRGTDLPYDEQEGIFSEIEELTKGYSAAAFASLRSNLKAHEGLTAEKARYVIRDHIPPAIGQTRDYQKFQALLNCTRRSLLPDSVMAGNMTLAQLRDEWEDKIRELEAKGIR
jgi:AAA+ superfamily predicted ATPase